jgi:uncharacterized cupin superfamily protein
MPQAPMRDGGSGLIPDGDGWFVVNVRDTSWLTSAEFGSTCVFEDPDAEWPRLGVNISVIEPGQPNCLYHAESEQEGFLVLAGECLLIVEGAERPLRQWDYFHCPPDVEHVLVGAGDGPCTILALGARAPGGRIVYPVSEPAARHGASAERETPDPREAYANVARPRPGRPASWDRLPWARRS